MTEWKEFWDQWHKTNLSKANAIMLRLTFLVKLYKEQIIYNLHATIDFDELVPTDTLVP